MCKKFILCFCFILLCLSIPIYAEQSDLIITRQNIQFLNVTENTNVLPQQVTIINNTNKEISVGWSLIQQNDIFSINTEGYKGETIAPKESVNFNVVLHNTSKIGDYDGELLIFDKENINQTYKINLHAIIESQELSNKVSSIDIYPKYVSVPKGSKIRFLSKVNGINDYSESTFSSISGNTSNLTKIDENNILVIDKNEESKEIYVNITSATDQQITATSKVSIIQNGLYTDVSPLYYNTGITIAENTPDNKILLHAFPSNGYKFTDWKDSKDKSISQNAITELSNYHYDNYIAEFEKQNEPILIDNFGNGYAISPKSGNNSQTILKAVPEDYAVFSGWYQNKILQSTELDYPTKGGTIIPVFDYPEYTVDTFSYPNNGGNVTGTDSYQKNSTLTISATPNDGYEFKEFIYNGQSVSNNILEINGINKNLCISAIFTQNNKNQNTDNLLYKQSSVINNKLSDNVFTENIDIPEVYQSLFYHELFRMGILSFHFINNLETDNNSIYENAFDIAKGIIPFDTIKKAKYSDKYNIYIYIDTLKKIDDTFFVDVAYDINGEQKLVKTFSSPIDVKLKSLTNKNILDYITDDNENKIEVSEGTKYYSVSINKSGIYKMNYKTNTDNVISSNKPTNSIPLFFRIFGAILILLLIITIVVSIKLRKKLRRKIIL